MPGERSASITMAMVECARWPMARSLLLKGRVVIRTATRRLGLALTTGTTIRLVLLRGPPQAREMLEPPGVPESQGKLRDRAPPNRARRVVGAADSVDDLPKTAARVVVAGAFRHWRSFVC